MTEKRSVYIPHSYADFNSNEAMLPAAIDSLARMLAKVLSIQPLLFVHKADLTSELSETPEPRENEDGDAVCSSCGALMKQRSVLCQTCKRVSPQMSSGPSIVKSIFRSCHPEYTSTQRHVEHVAARLDLRGFAVGAERLADALCGIAVDVGSGANVRIEQNVLRDFPAYLVKETRKTKYGLHTAGGLGFALRDEIEPMVGDWLTRCDAYLKSIFNLAGDNFDDSLVENQIRNFASRIADRIARVDNATGPKYAFLSADLFESVCEAQFSASKLEAQEELQRDVETMEALYAFALDGSDDSIARIIGTEGMLQNVVDLLVQQPPELEAIATNVAATLHFDLLIGLIDQCSSTEQTVEAFRKWRSDEAVANATVQALDRAMRDARAHRHGANKSLDFFRKASSSTATELLLPATPWHCNAIRWSILPLRSTAYCRRRIGLNPCGTRVVLLVSLLQRMAGDSDGLPRGIVDSAVVGRVAAVERGRAQLFLDFLDHDLAPLLSGVEFADAKTRLMCFTSEQLEGDVMRAVAEVSRFSLQHIATATAPRTPVGQVVRNKLQKLIPFYMPEPLPDLHPQLAEIALRLALPLLVDVRSRIGAGLHQRTQPLGDRLRCIEKVRSWHPSGAPLVLRQRDAEEAGADLWDLLQRLGAQPGAGCRYRPGRRECVFDTKALLAALLPVG